MIKGINIDIAIEEMGELIQALSKLKRLQQNDKTLRVDEKEIINSVKEELVDVDITLERIAEKIFTNYEDYDTIYMNKVEDYEKRLK